MRKFDQFLRSERDRFDWIVRSLILDRYPGIQPAAFLRVSQKSDPVSLNSVVIDYRRFVRPFAISDTRGF